MEDASKKNKYAILAFGAILLIILVIYAFSRQPAVPGDEVIQAPSNENVSSTISTTLTSTSSPTSTPIITDIKPSIPTPTTKPKISGSASAYQKAIESNQYRIQFSNCQGNPGKLTLKQSVKVMLDNRDATTHTFGFGGAKYTVKGYSFVIVNAPKAGTHYITCDGGGAAQMITQK